MTSGERTDLLRVYGRTPIRRWRFDGVHGIRQAMVVAGTMPDGETWFVDSHRLGLSHVFADGETALAAADVAMGRYAAEDDADRYGGAGPTGHATGRWVEVPPAIGPRITYGERPGDRTEP